MVVITVLKRLELFIFYLCVWGVGVCASVQVSMRPKEALNPLDWCELWVWVLGTKLLKSNEHSCAKLV